MPYPTTGYQPGDVTYAFTFSDADQNSSTITISGPAWSSLPGWDDALDAAAAAFRDSILATIPGISARGNRMINAAVADIITTDD